MTHESEALWRRIRDFPIDDPGAARPFSARLAREQGWTPAYAARVVHEYRRFAFLAVASGHGATPSKAVDEAWHLHLLYTRNYWEGFCPQALGRPLHHQPADGGAEDEAKYEGWYAATLASYERLFGEAPPEDVWLRSPSPLRGRGARGEGLRKLRIPWFALLPLLLLLGGCDEPLNPLDWHGPPFLGLIAGIYLLALLAAYLVREALRAPIDGPPAEEWGLHVYEEAALNEGLDHAVATAIARLHAAGAIVLDPKKGRFRAAGIVLGDTALDRALLRAAGDPLGADLSALRRAARPVLDEMGESLRRQALWVSGGTAFRATVVPFAVASLPLLLAGAKVLVGISRERPVGFLIVGSLFAALLNLAFLVPPKRSRYGDAVLERLRAHKRGARHAGGMGATPDGLAAGVALFGVATLADGPYGELRAALVPPSSGGGDSGGGSSGCGGGGGCGGGCGGCGGG